ncbi:hypothetical protein GNI_030080 [Gregarina niphandrodes]|uniref:Uncharacterized protein n=1 Tax=Gregarina niphandrodes TaxID=110365 RepID=A0A023BBC2_GRENI|nr:hypothetical protein GNI_030080 [Gregarina niphandrodes]EZG79024.1 hypothetical protein GNI_030080 [Gregarina niphandrodes]|eukprot:XP_011129142.1 hypothetical protein GNI_030080 [Gregarina niphandrodes]
MKLGFTGLFLTAWAMEQDCLKLPVRLWLHHDATGSYKNLIGDPQTYVQKLLDALNDKLDDFDFGGSLFRDRGAQAKGGCFSQGVTFGTVGTYSSKVSAFASFIETQSFGGGGDDPEDSLSAIPFIGRQQFSGLGDEALRIFMIITDERGKYHGLPDREGELSPDDELPSAVENPNPEASVSCDPSTWYPTLEQLTTAITNYRLLPVTLAAGDSADWWRTFYTDQLGLSEMDFAVFSVDNSAESIAQGVIESVNAVSCNAASTSTTAPTSASSATGNTEADRETDTAPTPASSPTGNTEADRETDTASGEEDHRKKHIIIGTSAAAGGIAALAAVAGIRRFLQRSAASSIEPRNEAAARDGVEGNRRESIIAVDETQYV